MYKHLLGASFIAFAHALPNQLQDQHVLSTPEIDYGIGNGNIGERPGVLRRYAIAGGVIDAEDVLNRAMVRSFILWRTHLILILKC